MLESLKSLSDQLQTQFKSRLYFFHGKDTEVLSKISESVNIISLCYNLDITPYAVKRDKELSDWCAANKIKVVSMQDYTLHSLNDIRTKTGNVYQVFTPFKNACLKENVRLPVSFPVPKTVNVFVSQDFKLDSELSLKTVDSYALPHGDLVDIYGGREAGQTILSKISTGDFKTYDDDRNDMAAQKTTKLSAYLKFGCLSFREVFHESLKKYGAASSLVSELYWREFYYQLSYHKAELLEGQTSESSINRAQKVRMEVNWKKAIDYPDIFNAWKDGKTGFPVVDAAMRQLNTTVTNNPVLIITGIHA